MTDANNWRELVRMAAAQLPDDALCCGTAERLRATCCADTGPAVLRAALRSVLRGHLDALTGMSDALHDVGDTRSHDIGAAVDLLDRAIDALDSEEEAA